MIGFVGLTHLGIVSSIAAASKGVEVMAFDPEETRCVALREGRFPILEPGLPELLEANRSRIQFTSAAADLRRCQLIYFAIDIPTDENNQSDPSALERLIAQILPQAAPGTILVVLSQVLPGFTRRLAGQIAALAAVQGLVVYGQVETLVFGNAVERAVKPERFIVGCANPAMALPPVYQDLLGRFGCPILPMGYESAELCKISINAFLVSSVSTTNMLAEICEAIGADWSEIAPALRLDRRIGPDAYLGPGLGIAGGNLERDLISIGHLAAEHGTDARLAADWLALSRYRRDWVLRVLHAQVLSKVSDPVIAIWGLAYKPNTHSTKNSPSLALIEALPALKLCYYDPQVVMSERTGENHARCQTALEACQGAHALVIMTPWQEFAAVKLAEVQAALTGRTIIDPFGVLAAQIGTKPAFDYFSLGAPPVLQAD